MLNPSNIAHSANVLVKKCCTSRTWRVKIVHPPLIVSYSLKCRSAAISGHVSRNAASDRNKSQILTIAPINSFSSIYSGKALSRLLQLCLEMICLITRATRRRRLCCSIGYQANDQACLRRAYRQLPRCVDHNAFCLACNTNNFDYCLWRHTFTWQWRCFIARSVVTRTWTQRKLLRTHKGFASLICANYLEHSSIRRRNKRQ